MDHQIDIAVTDRKNSRKYKNQRRSWEWLEEKNRNPVRTTESTEEYRKLPRTKRDDIKDHGGCVPGMLRGGSRKAQNVIALSFGMLDGDHIPTEVSFCASVKNALPNTLWHAYTTHSHTPETQRYRLVVAFNRKVKPDEYPPLMRKLAQKIGIDIFDPCSYEANRMMFWPSCPSDGIFDFQKNAGEPLDVDVLLAEYDDWRDVCQWPTCLRESEAVKREIKRQQDPLAKEGVVGAFCRAYSIEDAIESFLSDIYEPSAMNGRYDYIPADSSAGVVLYDGKFAYSHHATDPACGMLLNAFDLVRCHKYGDLDEKASFKAMSDFAVRDEMVKDQFTQERIAQAESEFTNENWQNQLELEKTGAVKESFGNFLLILNHDPDLSGIALNQMRDGVDVIGELPWKRVKPGWSDTDAAKLYEYLQNNYGIYSPTKANHAVLAAAAKRIYHPIRNYLNSLPLWDGIPRVETLIIDYFGAEDNQYVRAVTRKTFAAAVARVFVPAIKFDYMLVLNGRTGLGKSTFFDKLAGEWFSDSLNFADMGKGKDAPEKIQGFWILEIPELAGIRKADVNNIKAFLSRRDDNYRASYGRSSESHPRQCIIVGSTNSESMGFLRDVTGNRRFWPIRVGGTDARKGWDVTDNDVFQIWAEAKIIWENGEKLYLENEIAQMAGRAQTEALETDEREGMVREYLERLLPDSWEQLDIYRRQEFMRGDDDPTQPQGVNRRETVCNMEIWCECFNKRREDFERTDSHKIMSIMEKVGGWERSEKKKRMGPYGVVPYWERVHG